MLRSHLLRVGTLALLLSSAATAQRLMENLDRGVVAIRMSPSEAFLSWRLLGLDPAGTGFNVYRSTDGGAWSRLNPAPLTGGTHFNDTTADLSQPTRYHVRPVVGGVEQDPSKSAAVWDHYSHDIPLQRPAGGTTPDGVDYTYSPNDASVGDLDGDGDYELVLKWDPSNSKDNSHSGHTGKVFLDGYEMDGTFLWRIDLGVNIRAGAHYTQFMVYDFDGDGRAEIVCKTADGTTDGLGAVLGDPSADWRNASGRILEGPEFLSAFDGSTGGFIDTVDYVPARGNVGDWGDTYGNRVDRFLAGVAYLDGQRPSVVMSRGYYTRTVLAAWDLVAGKLVPRWVFDSDEPGNSAFAGQGCHSLSVADVDADGFDEVIFGACTIDHDGTGMHSTGRGHGDALHVSDMDPTRPGLEAWMPHEGSASGATLRDAATGEILVEHLNTGDIGRGVAAHIDAAHPGYQVWSYATGGVFGTDGGLISPNTSGHMMNFLVWWTGDLQREFLSAADGAGRSPVMEKWNGNGSSRLLSLYSIPAQYDTKSINGTKANPCLSGDLIGDWREEVIYHTADNTHLRIFSTTAPTAARIPTLMHDPQYRVAIAWQNVGYNQPPHPGFYLGEGMAPPPTPDIAYVGAQEVPPVPQGLQAVPASASSVELSWNDDSDTELGFRIERSENGADFSEVAVVDRDREAFTDTGLSPATAFHYRIRAYNTGGSSPPSEPASATTLPGPLPVEVTASLPGVTLADRSGPVLATSPDFDLAGGNAVVLLLTVEGAADDPIDVRFAGQDMIRGAAAADSGPGIQQAAIFHLIDPATPTGSFEIRSAGADAIDLAYSALALANVDRVADSASVGNTADSGTVVLDAATDSGGHVLAAAANNAFGSRPAPSHLSGDATQELLAPVLIDTSGHLHLHGTVPAGGLRANTFGNLVQRNAFAVLTLDAVQAALTPEQQWRLEHFGTTEDSGEAADDADPDGDHTPNWAERLLGLDPKDPNSAFAVSISRSGPSSALLQWPNAPGVSFTVESSATLATPWTPEATILGDDTAAPLSHPVDIASPATFFRVAMERP